MNSLATLTYSLVSLPFTLISHVLFYFYESTIVNAISRGIRKGALNIALPGGRVIRANDDQDTPPITLIIHHPARMLLRCLPDAKMGLSEAYMHGDFDAQPSLEAFIKLLLDNESSLKSAASSSTPRLMKPVVMVVQSVGHAVNYAEHVYRRNSIGGSRANIRDHYDVGNAFYKTFLDQEMIYSCALYKGKSETEMDLHDAQMQKFDMILDRLSLSPGYRVLEIGCGWGALAIRGATKRQAHWRGVTISEEQIEWGTQRVEKLNLEEKVELTLCDYREATGLYDAVVSLEMLEHVGHDYMPGYFEKISSVLRKGGKACIQVMTWPDATYEEYRKSSDFFKKHLSPGLNLPSLSAIKNALPSSLTVENIESIGPDYAPTLLAWISKMDENKEKILDLGYDEYFYRKWRFFLCTCVPMFADGHVDVSIITLKKI